MGGIRVCRHFARTGKCRYGAKCHFSHDENDISEFNDYLTVISVHREQASVKLCPYSVEGKVCPYEARCWYMHDKALIAQERARALRLLTAGLTTCKYCMSDEYLLVVCKACTLLVCTACAMQCDTCDKSMPAEAKALRTTKHGDAALGKYFAKYCKSCHGNQLARFRNAVCPQCGEDFCAGCLEVDQIVVSAIGVHAGVCNKRWGAVRARQLDDFNVSNVVEFPTL